MRIGVSARGQYVDAVRMGVGFIRSCASVLIRIFTCLISSVCRSLVIFAFVMLSLLALKHSAGDTVFAGKVSGVSLWGSKRVCGEQCGEQIETKFKKSLFHRGLKVSFN